MCGKCGHNKCSCHIPITIDYNKVCGCGQQSCNSCCERQKCGIDNNHGHNGIDVYFCKEVSDDCLKEYGIKKGVDHDTLIVNLAKKINRLEKAYGSLLRKVNLQDSELAMSPNTYTIGATDTLPTNNSSVTLKKYDIVIRKDFAGVVLEEHVFNGVTWIKTI